MMEQTKIYRALQGVRGRAPVNMAALEQLMVRFSQLVVEQRWIKEIDINPLLASSKQLVALDARVVLHDGKAREADLPKLAIRPYPVQYIRTWKMEDGTPVTIRPIRPEDEPLLVRFHHTLSDQTVRQRYFAPLKLDQRTSHERLTRVCFNDYDRELALVVDQQDAKTKQREIIAVGRLSRAPQQNDAEFAVLVADAAQGRGLGAELARCLIEAARQEKIGRLIAYILPENLAMRQICKSLGFQIEQPAGETMMTATLDL
jgi:acetyltransferase